MSVAGGGNSPRHLATSANCRKIVIAFVERHPKLVARENRDFSGRSSTKPGLLKET